jgi:hypothetical protein
MMLDLTGVIGMRIRLSLGGVWSQEIISQTSDESLSVVALDGFGRTVDVSKAREAVLNI